MAQNLESNGKPRIEQLELDFTFSTAPESHPPARSEGMVPPETVEETDMKDDETKLADARLNPFEAREERRRERLLHRADRQEAIAESSEARAKEISDMIPFGQPILVGHHSERADRRRRDRMHRLFGGAHQARENAEELRRRAKRVGTAGISSDDPDATAKLEAKALDLESSRETMKRANAYWKKHGNLEGFEELAPEAKADAIRGMTLMGDKVPFPPYSLRNIGGRIRATRKRIEELHAQAEAEPQELSGPGFHVHEDRLDNRLLFQFDAKPPKEVCRLLGRSGFHWSRTRGAWCRKLNPAAWVSARYVAEKLPDSGSVGELTPNPEKRLP